MKKYFYQALNEMGTTISGVIEADSEEMAKMSLSARGFVPSKVVEGDRSFSKLQWLQLDRYLSTVNATDLILFTKQFRTMLNAGIPMLALLQVLQNQVENQKLKRIIGSVFQDIKEGSSLYEAFRKHPQAFSSLYCSMIQAGEKSGELAEVLGRLTYILEHEHKVKSDIKSALQYPIIVLVLLVAAFFVLLTYVIPKFAAIFRSAKIDLPLPTQICISMYQFVGAYWVYLVLGSVALIGSLLYYFGIDRGRYFKDSTLMRLPIIGPLYIKAAMSRFASIFAILQYSGVGILESMKILSNTIGNKAISREFEKVKQKVEQGSTITSPLKSARFFPPMVIHMIAIGEMSGNLDAMLKEIAAHYDSEVEYAMKRLSDAIGPILTISLAAMVGFFALAIFLPMWDMTKMVK